VPQQPPAQLVSTTFLLNIISLSPVSKKRDKGKEIQFSSSQVVDCLGDGSFVIQFVFYCFLVTGSMLRFYVE
jgi:hypothetical protein